MSFFSDSKPDGYVPIHIDVTEKQKMAQQMVWEVHPDQEDAEVTKAEDGTESEGSQRDALHIGQHEAWWILEQETTRYHFPNGSQDLRHQILGGVLVEGLCYYSKMNSCRERILNRDWLAFKWSRDIKAIDVILGKVVADVFPHGKELGHTMIGVLIILDTSMVESIELSELADHLMGLKVQVDSYNDREQTDHYVMFALALYTKEETDRYLDARVASANAVISAFNSFMRRPTLDLNRYILDTEVGRALNIRNETRWRVDPEHFKEDGAVRMETMLTLTERLMEFLNNDDGLRCKEDDLTFPFKKDRDEVPRFLSGYQVRDEIPRNTFGVEVEGQDAEALYWVRFRLLANGAGEDEVPPLPELDLEEYSFRPWRKGQSADMPQEERDRVRESRQTSKEEKRRQRSLDRQNRWVSKLHDFLVTDVARAREEKKARRQKE